MFLHESLDYELALKDYDRALVLDPMRSEVYASRALLFYNMKRYEDAIRDYTRAFELNPEIQGLHERGLSKFEIHDYKGALEDFNKLSTFSERKPYNDICKTLIAMKDYRGAARVYTEAIEANPDEMELYLSRGLNYIKLGQIKEADADFRRALGIFPQLIYSNNEKGWAAIESADYNDAIDKFIVCLHLDPENIFTIVGLALAYYTSGDKVNAIIYRDKATALHSELVNATSDILWNMGDNFPYMQRHLDDLKELFKHEN